MYSFLDKKTEYRLLLKSFEARQAPLARIPVDSQWGSAIDEELALHSQEKSFYFCSFFLKGKVNVLGRSTKAFIPLYIHEVSLVCEEEIFLLKLIRTIRLLIRLSWIFKI